VRAESGPVTVEQREKLAAVIALGWRPTPVEDVVIPVPVAAPPAPAPAAVAAPAAEAAPAPAPAAEAASAPAPVAAPAPAEAAAGVEPAPAPASTGDARPESGRPERLVSMPPPPPARSAELQLELRRARVFERVATVRDAFRLLEDLGLGSDDARAVIAQTLKELQSESSLSKDGRDAEAKDALDALEAQLGPIEDKLLALDDSIEDLAFESRMTSMTTNKRAIARYGRLLASRRMPVGPRRNRFEWLALQLLTGTNDQGQMLVVPPDRARPLLHNLIGELPRKLKQQEVDEATDYLFEAGHRLDAMSSVEELFESGLYADVHGHKVSMREYLLSAELVYRIALFEAKLHNHIERFVAEQARAAEGDEAATRAGLRATLRQRLLAEREDVDTRLGAKPRVVARATVSAPSRPSAMRVAPKAKRSSQAQIQETVRKKKLSVALDRGLLVAIASVIVVSLAVYVVRQQSGLSDPATVRKLTSPEMPRLSSLLVAGELRTKGDDQSLHGWISGTRWRALAPDARRDAAAELARNLAAAGIDRAELFDHNVPVISIREGVVLSAIGAAP
jgi:hypothetical protein